MKQKRNLLNYKVIATRHKIRFICLRMEDLMRENERERERMNGPVIEKRKERQRTLKRVFSCEMRALH